MSLCCEQDFEPGIRQQDIDRRWRARGYSCALWIDPPEQRWEQQINREDELIMALSGEISVRLGQREHRLRPGQELNIPAHEPYSIRHESPGTLSWLYGFKVSA